MKELEEQIDELQEHLPEGYTVCIKIQNGTVWCVVEHPNKEEADIHEDEACLSMVLKQALHFCHDHKGGRA